MTIGKDRLERTMRERASTVERTNPRYSGFLGLTTGGEDVVDVPSRPGFVWVRLRNVGNEVIKAFNDAVSPIFNLPVIVERDLSSPIQYKVLGRDVDVYGASNWGTASSYVPGHNAQHSFDKSDQGTGGDITWIFSDQFLPLLVTPSGSSGSPNALVWPYLYHDDEGNYFCGGNTGTASLVGNNATGGNNSRMSLIYLDADTGNPTILAGTTEFASTITGTCGVLPYIPGVPDNNDIALAGVRLPTGTSTINWANLYDIRELVHAHPNEEIYWDDIRVPISAVKRLGNADPDWEQFQDDGSGSIGVYALAFSTSTDQEVYFSVQVPHSWELGTDLNPHIHWSPSTTGTGSVTWKMEYTISDIGGTFGHTATLAVTDAADGVALRHQYVDLGDIDMSSYIDPGDVSIMLMCRLYRDVSDGDDYGADAFLLETDFHFQKDTPGSISELSK